jgi:hypothetical protein
MTWFKTLFLRLMLLVVMQSRRLNSLLTDKYLTHHWTIFDSNMKDVVGRADMEQVSPITFATDRFGNSNSSLNLNGGSTRIPGGVYFDSREFTISVWVYPKGVKYHSRIIDFSPVLNSYENRIILVFDNAPNIQNLNYEPALFIFDNKSTTAARAISSKPLINEKWQFLTITFNGTASYIYIDGCISQSTTYVNYYILPTVFRNYTYIGKGSESYSYLDDLRFYNKSLSKSEIFDLMCDNQTSKFISRKIRLL